MIKKSPFVLILLVFLMFFSISVNAKELLNWNFEEGYGLFTQNAYHSNTEKMVYSSFSLSDEGRNESQCVLIENLSKNDARFEYKVKAKANHYYKISGWIRTEDVGNEGEAIGANLSIIGTRVTNGNFVGTQDWKYVEFYGKTGDNQTEFVLALRLGGYSGDNTGKAWFDDITIDETDIEPKADDIQDFDTSTKESDNSGSKKNELNLNTDDVLAVGLVLMAFFLFIVILAYRSMVAAQRQDKQEDDQ